MTAAPPGHYDPDGPVTAAGHKRLSEQFLLGLLWEGDERPWIAADRYRLNADDFQPGLHREIFYVLRDARANGDRAIGSAGVWDRLDDAAQHPHHGPAGPALHADMLLWAQDAMPAQADALARNVRWASQKRAIDAAMADVRQTAAETYNGDEAVSALLTAATKVAQSRPTARVKFAREVVAAAVDELRELSKVGGMPTGVDGLDTVLGGGFLPGQMYVIGADTSVGKTALGIQSAWYAAKMPLPADVRRGPVLYVSSEMSATELLRRLLFARNRTANPMILPKGAPQRRAFAAMDAAKADIAALPIGIIDDMVTVPEMRAEAAAIHFTEGPPRMVVVDFLQHFAAQDDSDAGDVMKLTLAVQGLKELARECHCPVLVLSQLRRRVNERPTENDLLGAGAIAQAADVVLLIHRPDEQKAGALARAVKRGEDAALHRPDLDAADTLNYQVIVAKNRHGERRRLPQKFYPRWGLYDAALRDLTDEYSPPPAETPLPDVDAPPGAQGGPF